MAAAASSRASIRALRASSSAASAPLALRHSPCPEQPFGHCDARSQRSPTNPGSQTHQPSSVHVPWPEHCPGQTTPQSSPPKPASQEQPESRHRPWPEQLLGQSGAVERASAHEGPLKPGMHAQIPSYGNGSSGGVTRTPGRGPAALRAARHSPCPLQPSEHPSSATSFAQSTPP